MSYKQPLVMTWIYIPLTIYKSKHIIINTTFDIATSFQLICNTIFRVCHEGLAQYVPVQT